VLDFSWLFIFNIFRGRVSLPRSYAGLSFGVYEGIPLDAWCSPVWSAKCLTDRFGVLTVVATVVAAVAAHLFSQYNIEWRSFLQARSSECQSFDSCWCFISTKCGSNVSAGFWSHGTHAVWFHNLVAILEKENFAFIIKLIL
jgi:hypothetical protein